MDFEEYMSTTGMEEQTENSCAWKFYKELYKAGQQSRQSEIDELQKLIDDLKVFCIKGVESNMLSIEYNQALIDMHKILKGDQS